MVTSMLDKAFSSMEHFKLELIEYLDYYNNLRIKVKLKGLPLLFTDNKPFLLINYFLSNFLGSLHSWRPLFTAACFFTAP